MSLFNELPDTNLPPLGSCYIDPTLEKAFVPFAQRSASKALRTVARGTRLPMPQSPTIRFFLWWKNGEDRVDIDLSGAMYDSNWKMVSYLSFYRLRDEEMYCHHSGDITSAPHGACEFIDLSIEHLLQMNVQYAVMTINSFTHQPYCDLPECFAGWMGRKKPKSGEVFEAKTVVDKVDLASDTTMVIPVILDVKNREVIWTDMAVGNGRRRNTLHGNLDATAFACRAVANLNKPNLYDLFSMHVEARGTLVDSAEGADKVYSLNSGITPYDYSLIASEYMA